jgi:NAD-dependent dihydropyrimidine dehydrogenase PreA subunit
VIELIVEDRCTSCNACVAACPTHVFDPRPGGAPFVARPDQCQTCFMCELYCEADAIYVGPDRRIGEPVDVAEVMASGQLGRLRRDYGWSGVEERPLRDFWRLGPLLRGGAEIAAERYALRHEEPASSREN